jgi:ribosomal protein S18 acetylase RimI-like enzyme
MVIRDARLCDISALYEIEFENYGLEESTEKETFKAIVEHPHAYPETHLKVLFDQTVIGFYCVIEESGCFDIVDIAVALKHQRQGHGSRLIEDCIVFCANKRCSLIVRSDNIAAISLYTKHGFKQSENFKNYYDDCDGLKFVKD